MKYGKKKPKNKMKNHNKIIALLIFQLAALATGFSIHYMKRSQAQTTVQLSQLGTGTPEYHTIQLGWSLGPMDGMEVYGKNLFQGETKKDRGFYRVFVNAGPSVDTNIAYVIAKVKMIVDRSSVSLKWPKIMLVLRDFPYSDLKNHDTSVLTPKQDTLSKFSNRFVPSNIPAYERYLTRLMEELEYRNYLPYISIELWGEPNADNFFWGYAGEDNTFPAFKAMTSVKYNIIKDYPVRVYHADLTSGLQRDSSYKNKGNYWRYANSDDFFLNPVIRSHSFYWVDSGGEFDVNNNNWVDRPGEVCISEYNMYVKVNKDTPRDSIFNSDEWGWRFYQFLKFVYQKKQENKGTVTEVYVHSLCNYSNKYDDKGSLGLIGKYQTPEHWVYYLPKKGWIALNDIHEVIKEGYYPIQNGLQGKTKKITWDQKKKYTVN